MNTIRKIQVTNSLCTGQFNSPNKKKEVRFPASSFSTLFSLRSRENHGTASSITRLLNSPIVFADSGISLFNFPTERGDARIRDLQTRCVRDSNAAWYLSTTVFEPVGHDRKLVRAARFVHLAKTRSVRIDVSRGSS